MFEEVDVAAWFGGVEVEAVACGPVVGFAGGGEAFFVFVDEAVGVHGAEADGGHGVVEAQRFFAGVGGRVFGEGDVDAEAFVFAGKAAGEDEVEGVAGAGGGDIEAGFAGAAEHADGDGGDAEECAFERGGDGAGVDDVYAAVGAVVHAGDEEIGLGGGAEAVGEEGGDGELDAVGGSAVDGDALHALAVVVMADHEGDVEGDAVAGGGLDGEWRGDEEIGEGGRRTWFGARAEWRGEEGIVHGDDAGGADAVVVGEEDTHGGRVGSGE